MSSAAKMIRPRVHCWNQIVAAILGFVLLGLSFGQSSGAAAAQFANAYRYTASSLTADLAWLFGAGFAYEVLASRLRTRAYRIAAGIAITLAVIAIWFELAVDGVSKVVAMLLG